MSVRSQIEKYLKSREGKALLNEARERLINSGDGKLANGGEIVSAEVAARLANDLAQMVSGAAGAVPGANTSISCSTPTRNGDSWEVSLSFNGDLSRSSLYSGGVSNIVALFNNGYKAKAQVFGMWHGKWTGSRTSRPALYFMQEAVDEFNAKYAGIYDVSVMLGSEYM